MLTLILLRMVLAANTGEMVIDHVTGNEDLAPCIDHVAVGVQGRFAVFRIIRHPADTPKYDERWSNTSGPCHAQQVLGIRRLGEEPSVQALAVVLLTVLHLGLNEIEAGRNHEAQ